METADTAEKSFIDEYIGLIKSFAGKYSVYGVIYDDLVQEGMIGLMKAREKYDDSRGVKFSTFASYYIKGMMLKHIESERKINILDVEFEKFGDKIACENNGSAGEETSEPLPEIPADFPENERKVIEHMFIENRTLSETALLMGFTRERTRQIKQKAVRRLRINGKLTRL